MFHKIIDRDKEKMMDTLAGLVSFRSVAKPQAGEYPFGKEVDDALCFVCDEAKKMGFAADNKKVCTEICFGAGEKKVYIGCHADVVPVGVGWVTDPFTLVRRDGKLIGRGTLDDKGSAVAVLYAMKALKEAGYTPKADVRLLIGGAEEIGMLDLPRYMDQYGYPDEALTPDGSFPIVNTEAGMFDAEVRFGDHYKNTGAVRLVSLKGGVASNCVPDHAVAVIEADDAKSVAAWFDDEKTSFLKDFSLDVDGDRLTLTSGGINAHASVAYEGKNAVTDLAVLLDSLFEDFGVENKLTRMLTKYYADDCSASHLGLTCEGPILGSITLNVGVCDTDKGFFTVDQRLPVEGIGQRVADRHREAAEEFGFLLKIEAVKEYTNIPQESDFMQKLGTAFEHATGMKAEYVGCRGLTYAKVFRGKGVAFGPVFDEEGNEAGNLHGDNEFIREDVLMRLAHVYAQVIYELWC